MTQGDWNPRQRHRPRGPLIVAGVLLGLGGLGQIAVGCAVAAGEAAVFSGGGYWYRADNTAWGWVSLLIGFASVVLGTGLAVASDRLRRLRAAVRLGLLLAVVSGMNLCFLAPQYPVWSTIAIGADVFVIWALTTRPDLSGEVEDDAIGR